MLEFPLVLNFLHVEVTYLTFNLQTSCAPPQGPRLASSKVRSDSSLSVCFRNQFHFPCPIQELTANASEARETTPKIDTTVLSVKTPFQLPSGFPSSIFNSTMIAARAPRQRKMAHISNVHVNLRGLNFFTVWMWSGDGLVLPIYRCSTVGTGFRVVIPMSLIESG